MKVLDKHNSNGWITAIIEGRWVQAKVYDEPSSYGINDGRVSKLCIGKTDARDHSKPFFDQMDYNYDRGLDFCDLDTDLLNRIVEELENLPKLSADEDENTSGMRM